MFADTVIMPISPPTCILSSFSVCCVQRVYRSSIMPLIIVAVGVALLLLLMLRFKLNGFCH